MRLVKRNLSSNLRALLIYAFVLMAAVFAYAVTSTDITMTWVVPSNVSYSISYPGACSASAFYFVESNCVYDSDVDGNGSKCVPTSDSAGTTDCQNAAAAEAVSIQNNGNVVLDVDGNFNLDFNGSDVNAFVLRVWLGNDTHCGTAGLGGWESPCSVTGATNPVTTTTCRSYNAINETTAGRLISDLAVNDTNGLCFSGDFNGGMSLGSHPVQFRLTGVNGT